MSTREVTNDTYVYDAMRYDHRAGENVWTLRVGTAEAIRREGLVVGGSMRGAPHQWLKNGFVDLELSKKHPYRYAAESGEL
jgi:hypothetical protein